MKVINIRLWALLFFANTFICGTTQVSGATFTNDQYQKALWMTTRFYGAQRSGAGPNWLLAEHQPTNVPNALQGNLSAFVKGQSFVKDADGAYDLSGGWFDCGDHVKFGQTEFYSAYMLILGYSEFPTGYDDHYSFDYNGYVAAKDYTWEGKKGKPNGIPDILDEIKYATDYFKKCVRDKSTFYYQVGDGDADHKHWVTAPVMATLSNSDGGEKDGSRMIKKATGNVTSMASLCGATLAAMARVYKPFDPAYAQSCLDKALVAYEFVNTTTKGNTGGGGYYPAKGKYDPDVVIFNAELYRTTGDAKYLTAAQSAAGFVSEAASWNHNFSLCYNNTEDLAFYLLATLGDKLAKRRLIYYTDTLYKPASGYFLTKKSDTWGILRYPANQAFVYALKDKLTGVTTLNPYTARSVGYIMGDNSKNFSYIVGFGAKHPMYPHHRNFFGEDSDSEKTVSPKTKYLQLGYMTGGSINDGAYEDLISSYTYSEGGIDYNAGLVGALGYINSILAPVNINKFGHPSPELGDAKSLCGTGSVTLTASVDLSALKAGETVTYKWYKGSATTPFEQGDAKKSVTVTSAGDYRCDLVEKSGAWTTSGSVTVSASLPAVNLGADLVLCEVSSKVLDAGVVGTGITYLWKRDAKSVATTQTYKAYSSGVYSVTVSASGCASVTDEITISSQLPQVQFDTICVVGKANLSVVTPGSYQWFDVATGGTALSSSASYSPTVTASKTFYVQDASSVAITTGPTTSSFTGTGVNWGNIGATFTAKAAFKITEFTITPAAIYNTDPVTITVKLSKNGNEIATYTSDAAPNKGVANYTLKFSTPIEISGAGDYVLTPSAGTAPVFYEKGPAYSTYSTYPSVLSFTGATNGTASNNPFPAMFNWKISAGSTCARTPVLAVLDPTNPNCGQSSTIKQTIVLAKGWNFIGVGVQLSSYSLTSVFGTNLSKIATVKNADGFYSATQAAHLNSLTEMKPGYGYFVYANSAVTLTLDGKALTAVSIPVKAGWNMIAYPYSAPSPTATALTSVWSSLMSVKSYEGFYIKNGTANNLNSLEFGNGYMLDLTSKGTLSY